MNGIDLCVPPGTESPRIVSRERKYLVMRNNINSLLVIIAVAAISSVASAANAAPKNGQLTSSDVIKP